MCSSQNDDKNAYFNRVKDAIADPKIRKNEKVKLVTLFSLRYEDDPLCSQLKQALRMAGLDSELAQITQMLNYAGRAKRQGELYAKNNFWMKKSKQLVSNMFMAAPD